MILSYDDYADTSRFEADIVVVGTGAGGAVVGTELAEAGFDVVFVEEGSWHPTSSFNPYISESVPRLYREAGATVILGSPPIPFMEGRCVGGSTVINGGMTWRTPERILAEWSARIGDRGLGPDGLDPWYSSIERDISARHQLPESVGDDSRLMAAGARKMGWKYQVNRRNQDRCVGSNNCVFGCPTGAKQSTLVSFMPRAMDAGARCLTEVRVEALRIRNGRCVGIEGRAIEPRTCRRRRRVEVHARIATVVAAGAVQTPYLLMRHRLSRQSGQLGRNFLCHPNVKLTAFYPHDVRGWQGVSQWTQIREFHDDGIYMAENMIPPGAAAAHLFSHGRAVWDLMQRYNQMVVCGVLVEDSSSGSIHRGPLGMPIARYDLTALDHQRFLLGVKRLARLHFEMGADTVILPFSNLHVARSVDDLEAIDRTQTSVKTLEPVTVHLMGTARMGRTPRDSVVDTSGELWDLPGCFVADASIFPTAIAVNPQLTIMALARRIAQRLGENAAHLRRRAAVA